MNIISEMWPLLIINLYALGIIGTIYIGLQFKGVDHMTPKLFFISLFWPIYFVIILAVLLIALIFFLYVAFISPNRRIIS